MTDRPIKRAGSGKGGSGGADPTKAGDPTRGGANDSGGDPAGPRPPGEYEVGYRRPPLHTRFQKGQPRPPRKSRPAPEPTFDDWMEEEIRLPMRFVDEAGKEQVFPKGKVLVKTAVNKAIKNGDLRQVKDYMPRRKASDGNEISQTDIEMVARFLANRLPDLIAQAGLQDADAEAGGPGADEDNGEGDGA